MEFQMAQFGTELKDPVLAETDHFPRMDLALTESSEDSVAVLDLSGVEFMGNAYARQTVVPAVEGVLESRYPARWIALAYDRSDHAARLEAVSQVLAELRLSVMLELRHRRRDCYTHVGYVERDVPFEAKRVQQKKRKMRDILGLLADRGGLYTNEVAEALDLTLPNCNYLLSELSRQRLVERVKQSSPSGGPIYLNRPALPRPDNRP